MNPGIVTSYIIGGFLLLSLLVYNRNLLTSSQETTLTTINQERRDNLVELLTCDFSGIGYTDETFGGDNPISKSDDDLIEFRTSPACVDDGDLTNGEIISISADPADLVASTTNPNDFYLYREDKNGVSSFAVTYFKLTYYKRNELTGTWEEIADPTLLPSQRNVKIEVEVVMESTEGVRTNNAGNVVYHRTAWKRTFIPNIINHPWN